MQTRVSTTTGVIHPVAKMRVSRFPPVGKSETWQGRIMSVAKLDLSEWFEYTSTDVVPRRFGIYANRMVVLNLPCRSKYGLIQRNSSCPGKGDNSTQLSLLA